jgi:type II secretory pathway pseudopilin PulG
MTTGTRWYRSLVGEGAEEDGFTIIEVLVAAFILVLGALAVFMTFGAAIHNVQRGKETQQGISVAQREMERIRVEPFEDIGVENGRVDPPSSASPTLPTSRVGPGGTTFTLKRTGQEESPPTFVEGDLSAGPIPRTSEDGTRVDVYRFVVCEEAVTTTPCLSKRVVVDVVPIAADNQGNYQHSYYELQSTVVDPTFSAQ